MIDFTNCPQLVNTYEGADFKHKIVYDGDIYMLKFGQKLESDEKKPLQASYSSSPVSEYLGSHIYGIAGIPVQETMLGTFDGKVVVACKDFIAGLPNADNLALVEFKKLENSFLGSSTAGGRTPLYDNLVSIFASHKDIGSIREAAEDRYWKMFGVDALIGNFDRHAGNWGYILDKTKNEIIGLAPVYDCGSCFYPQLNEDAMKDLLADRGSFEKRNLTFPTAALRIGKKKVNYHDFLLSPEGEKARSAIGELLPKIDFDKIEQLIGQIPYISDVRREFYAHMITLRKDLILQPAYELYREEHGLEMVQNHSEQAHDISLKSEASAARAASKALDELNDHSEPSRDRGQDR